MYLRSRIITTCAFCLFIFIVLIDCSKKKPTELEKEIILAKVGDRVITVNEFKVSYELSFAPLRRGLSPRRTYLNYMIKELLLAKEGFRLGLHKSHYVNSRVQGRRNHNLLEAFYVTHVHNKVDIPEDAIQEATKKASVKFRLLIWPTPSLEQAERAYANAQKTDLEDYVEEQLSKQEIPLEQKKFFETDWIDYLGMPPDMFDRIKDLELHKPSEPFPYGEGYAIFQVIDLELHGITTEELKHSVKRKKIYERLHNIEADRISHALMDSILTPMDVRVKGEILEQLAPSLFQWIQDGLPKHGPLIKAVNTAQDTSKDYLKNIKNLLKESLVTYQEGNKTVEDYLHHMNYYRKSLKQSTSLEDFKDRLITEIGTMIKNDVFIGVAAEEGFGDSTNIVNDLRIWEQKWTFDVYRGRVIEEIDVTQEEMQDYFKHRWRELGIANVDTTRFYKYENDVYNALIHEKHSAALEEEVEKLKKRYPVWINESVLDTLTLDETMKSLQMSFFLRKGFTGEFYAPTADPKWIAY